MHPIHDIAATDKRAWLRYLQGHRGRTHLALQALHFTLVAATCGAWILFALFLIDTLSR